MAHTYELDDNQRRLCVSSDEINKDARHVACSLYFVNEDNEQSLSVTVDSNDPSIQTIRGILEGDLPQTKARELLAAAYDNTKWPKEMRDVVKQWMQFDDEEDGEVPVGQVDAEYDSAPKTAPLSEFERLLQDDRP